VQEGTFEKEEDSEDYAST